MMRDGELLPSFSRARGRVVRGWRADPESGRTCLAAFWRSPGCAPAFLVLRIPRGVSIAGAVCRSGDRMDRLSAAGRPSPPTPESEGQARHGRANRWSSCSLWPSRSCKGERAARKRDPQTGERSLLRAPSKDSGPALDRGYPMLTKTPQDGRKDGRPVGLIGVGLSARVEAAAMGAESVEGGEQDGRRGMGGLLLGGATSAGDRPHRAGPHSRGPRLPMSAFQLPPSALLYHPGHTPHIYPPCTPRPSRTARPPRPSRTTWPTGIRTTASNSLTATSSRTASATSEASGGQTLTR